MKAAALALGIALGPGLAAACGLELVLATDVSGSIDAEEFRLQTEGLAAAFENAALIQAVGTVEGGVLVVVTQWSGASRQRQMTDWRLVTGEATAHAFAADIRGAGRAWRNFSTAIGDALTHARAVSGTAPAKCRRRVIDVSGDGITNEGHPPRPIADALAAEGYTINGLVIRGALPDPIPHFRNDVLAGEGAFLEIAESFEDFPRAILRKLLKEIAPPLAVSELGR